MSQEYGIILVTTSSQTEAEGIASTLVLEHLAACVNIHPVHSIYRWEGKINSDSEWQLVIKTKLNLFPIIAERIKEIHPYEVPEIIAIPIIQGSNAYLNWLASSLK